MNNYFKVYYLDTFLMIALILILCFNPNVNLSVYYMQEMVYPISIICIVISIISLILNITFHISKYKFIEKSLLFPKYYLMFFILIIFLGYIYNMITFMKLMHIQYYLSFLIVGYTFLSVYTTLSFRRIKKD